MILKLAPAPGDCFLTLPLPLISTFSPIGSKIDKASADEQREAAAISLAINENMSVSYGVSTGDFETASKKDEESSGISASYTTGGITVGLVANATDTVGGTAGTDKEFKEISVAFAF